MISLRPATPEDRFRIRRWLADPALPSWWGPRSSAEAEITLALESESAICHLILRDGLPIGYAHAVDIAVWQADAPSALAPGTWDLDLFIADATTRAADTTEALTQLAGEVFSTTFAVACCALVSIRNEAAARAYEKAGFRWSEIWHDRYAGPSWLMQLVRPR